MFHTHTHTHTHTTECIASGVRWWLWKKKGVTKDQEGTPMMENYKNARLVTATVLHGRNATNRIV